MEMSINSLPNRSIGYSPFFLNYGYHPVAPVQLLDTTSQSKVESVNNFVERIQQVWQKAKENVKRAQIQQQKYYDTRHKPESFEEGSYVLLSTQNLRLKGVPSKLRRRFVGPFKIIQCIGKQAYRLQLPDSWRIHDVFHVSLLKRWIESSYRIPEAQPQPDVALETDPSDVYEVEKILRWRRVITRTRRHSKKEYLILWKDHPIEGATWEPEANFTDPAVLQHNLQEDNPTEAEPRKI